LKIDQFFREVIDMSGVSCFFDSQCRKNGTVTVSRMNFAGYVTILG